MMEPQEGGGSLQQEWESVKDKKAPAKAAPKAAPKAGSLASEWEALKASQASPADPFASAPSSRAFGGGGAASAGIPRPAATASPSMQGGGSQPSLSATEADIRTPIAIPELDRFGVAVENPKIAAQVQNVQREMGLDPQALAVKSSQQRAASEKERVAKAATEGIAKIAALPKDASEWVDPPPQEGALPTIDPRWERVMGEYRAEGTQQFTPAEIAARREAGTWGQREDARERMKAFGLQQSKINERSRLLSEAHRSITQSRDIEAESASLQKEGESLEQERIALEQGGATQQQADAYNQKLSSYQQRQQAFVNTIRPIEEEGAYLDAWQRYVTQGITNAEALKALDPRERELLARQIEADANEGGGYAGTAHRFFKRLGGNVAGLGLRTLNFVGNIPNRAAGKEDYYSPFAYLADEVDEQLERIEADKPTSHKTDVFSDQWKVNPGFLHKMLDGALYAGTLSAAGATGGVRSMSALGMAGSSEDYYREGIESGLKPKDSEIVSLLLSGTEASIEALNLGPFVNSGARKSIMRGAVDAIKKGAAPRLAAKESFARYMAEQMGAEAGEEALTSVAQSMVKKGAEMATGVDQDTELTLQGLAGDAVMGAAIGGLMGGVGRLSQRPLYKEGVAWAVQNSAEFRQYVAQNIPEAEQGPILERFEVYEKVYRGLPSDMKDDAKMTVAHAVAEKERLKKEKGSAIVDDVVSAMTGNRFDAQIKEQDEIIAEASGTTLADVIKKQEIAKLQEQYDKAKLKSEVTGKPMPEGSVRPKDAEAPTPPPVEEAATPAEDAVPIGQVIPLSETIQNVGEQGEVSAGASTQQGVDREAERNAEEDARIGVEVASAWLQDVGRGVNQKSADKEARVYWKSLVERSEKQGRKDVLGGDDRGRGKVRASGNYGENYREEASSVRARSSQEQRSLGQQAGESGIDNALRALEAALSRNAQGGQKGVVEKMRAEAQSVVEEIRALRSVQDDQFKARRARDLLQMLREAVSPAVPVLAEARGGEEVRAPREEPSAEAPPVSEEGQVASPGATPSPTSPVRREGEIKQPEQPKKKEDGIEQSDEGVQSGLRAGSNKRGDAIPEVKKSPPPPAQAPPRVPVEDAGEVAPPTDSPGFSTKKAAIAFVQRMNAAGQEWGDVRKQGKTWIASNIGARQAAQNEEFEKRSKDAESASRADSEALSQEFEARQEAFLRQYPEAEADLERVEEKIARGEPLTAKEVAIANENIYRAEGYDFDESGGITKAPKDRKAKGDSVETKAATDERQPAKKKEEPPNIPTGWKRDGQKSVEKPTAITDEKNKAIVAYSIPGFEDIPIVSVKAPGGWRPAIKVGDTTMVLGSADSGEGMPSFAAARAWRILEKHGREKVEAMVEKSIKAREVVKGTGVSEQRPFRSDDADAIGFNYTTDAIARERFDLPSLEKIGSGSDRDVYDLGDGRVLKIAKTARGLEQNMYEGENIDFLPDTHEKGMNYVVVDRVSPAKASDVIEYEGYDGGEVGTTTIGEMLKELSKFSQKDSDNHTGAFQDAVNKYGFNDVMNYNILWNDFIAKRNWGVKDGRAIHLDGGTFGGVRMIDDFRGKKNLDDSDFREIYNRSRAAKKQFGDKDKATMYQRPTDRAPKTGKPNTDKVIKALAGFGVKVVAPSDKQEYLKAIDNFPDGVKSSWGLYDHATSTIYVNPEGPDLRNTLFHEAAHPVLSALMRHNPTLRDKFFGEIGDEKMPGSDMTYRQYGDKYSDKRIAIRMEEAIAQFTADVSDGKVKVSTKPDSLWQRFKAFIQDILAALGWDMRSIDLSKPDNVREFAAQFKKAMEKGIRITGLKPVDGTAISLQDDADRLVDGWYSRLDQMVAAKGNTQSGADWMKWAEARAKEGALSMEEVKWTGLADFLQGKAKVTPKEVRDFLKENRVKVNVEVLSETQYTLEDRAAGDDRPIPVRKNGRQIGEIRKGPGYWEGDDPLYTYYAGVGEDASETRIVFRSPNDILKTLREKEHKPRIKYSSYQLPGSSNYREVLVTLPKKPSGKAPGKYRIERTNTGYYFVVGPDGRTIGRGEDFESNARERLEEIERAGRDTEKEVRNTGDPEVLFRSSHFDEPNILVHLRLNDRVVDVPFTAEEEAAIDERNRLDAERKKLDASIITAKRKLDEARKPEEKRIHEEVMEDVKAGRMRLGDAKQAILDRQLDLSDSDSKELRDYRKLLAERDALTKRMPEAPKRRQEKVLFIEELQSDWGQQGKKKGFGGTEQEQKRLKDRSLAIRKEMSSLTKIGKAPSGEFVIEVGYDPAGTIYVRNEDAFRWGELQDEYQEVENKIASIERSAVPASPFVTSTDAWVELGMKQAIRMAVQGGYDRVAWSTGEQQFNRWGSQVFAWSKGKTGWRIVGKEQSGGEAFAGMEEALAQEAKESDTIITSKEELRDVVEGVMGRERSDYSPENWKTHINKMVDGMWERMQSEDSGTTMPRRKGMKGFYDKILPTVAKKVSKKLGGDGVVGEVSLPSAEAARMIASGEIQSIDEMVDDAATMQQQSISITPEMRARVGLGVPLMQRPKTTKASEWNAAVDAATDLNNLLSKGEEKSILDAADLITDPDGKAEFIRLMNEQMGVTTPPLGTKANQKKVSKVFLREELDKAVEAGKRAGIADVAKARKAFVEQVKEALSKDNLKGAITEAQARSIAARAASVNPLNPKAVDRFIDYAGRVVEKANYAEAVSNADALIKRARKLSKRDGIPLNHATALRGIAAVDPEAISDPEAFSAAVSEYLSSFAKVGSDKYDQASVADVVSAVEAANADMDARYAGWLKDEFGVDATASEAKAIYEAIANDEIENFINKELSKDRAREVTERLSAMAAHRKDALSYVDAGDLTKKKAAILNDLKQADPFNMRPDDLARYVFAVDNILVNNSYDGAAKVASAAKASSSINEARELMETKGLRKLWNNLYGRQFTSIPEMMRTLAGMSVDMGSLSDILGFNAIAKGSRIVDHVVREAGDGLSRVVAKGGRKTANPDTAIREEVIAFLIQQDPFLNRVESVANKIDLMRQAIDVWRSGDRTKHAADVAEGILNELPPSANTPARILAWYRSMDPDSYAVLKYMMDTMKKHRGIIQENTETFHNKDFGLLDQNYLPALQWQSLRSSESLSPDSDQFALKGERTKPLQARNTIERATYKNLPLDKNGRPKVPDLNLRGNFITTLGRNLYDAYTSEHWERVDKILSSPSADDVFGGASNVDMMRHLASRYYNAQRRDAISASTGMDRLAQRIASVTKKIATTYFLGGLSQAPKQLSEQITNLLINNAGNEKAGNALRKAFDGAMKGSDNPLLALSQVSERAALVAGTKWDNPIEVSTSKLRQAAARGAIAFGGDMYDAASALQMTALRKSDSYAASVAWLAAYQDALIQQGESVKSWQEEADLVSGEDKARNAAFAYADNVTDITQGVSDPSRGAAFARKSDSGAKNLLKALFNLFGSFSANMRSRIVSDAAHIIAHGPKSKEGARAMRSLLATAGSSLAFNAMAVYGVKALKEAISKWIEESEDDDDEAIALLAAISQTAHTLGAVGVDINDVIQGAHREAKRKRAGRTRDPDEVAAARFKQFYTRFTTDMAIAGFGEMPEAAALETANTMAYLFLLTTDPDNPAILKKDGSLIEIAQFLKDNKRTPFSRYGQGKVEPSLGSVGAVASIPMSLWESWMDYATMDESSKRHARYARPARQTPSR